MGFDDILKAGVAERNRQEHERRQLRMTLMPACDQLRANAEASVRRALQSMNDLHNLGTISTGFPPPPENDSVHRNFCLSARTISNSMEFQIAGSVSCRIYDDRLVYERSGLRISVTGFNFIVPRAARDEFHDVSGGMYDNLYAFEHEAFVKALEKTATRLSQA